MGVLITLFLRVTDLVEAQGRVARRAAVEIAFAFAAMLAATGLAVLTCIAIAVATAWALSAVMPVAAAVAFVACLLGLFALVAGVVAMRLASPRSTRRL